MAGIWVFADHRDGKFRRVVFEMLSAGRKIAEQVNESLSVVLLGQDTESLVPLLEGNGADNVIVLEDEKLEKYTSDAYADATTELIKSSDPTVVLFANSSIGLDLAPLVAQRLNTGLVSDVVEISYNGQLVFKRPIYAGKAFEYLAFKENVRPMLATIRPKAFNVAEPQSGKSAKVIRVQVGDFGKIRQIIKDVVRKVSGRVELTEADVVVSGGRGVKSTENFKVLEELADVLGAAVGASRAAVDEGWRESQYQVGQTGKVVSPQLYIACGISGAIQHLAGMGSSKCIVAVNKDPEAEIFKVADYGIVADLFDVLPVMTDEFRKLLAEVS